jgi:hypothetical protein
MARRQKIPLVRHARQMRVLQGPLTWCVTTKSHRVPWEGVLDDGQAEKSG